MWLFFLLIFFVLATAVLISTKRTKGAKIYLKITFFMFGILLMFRAINVGNDTDQYTYIFNNISQASNIQSYITNSRFEIGYIYLNKLLSLISDNPQIIFIITGAFTALSFGRFIYKYSELPWMSTFMFLTLQFFDLSMSGVRQIVSITILLFSYDFIVKRKFIKFLLLVLLASTIHTSAILFLIIYPLTSKLKGKKFYIVSTITCIGIFLGFQYIIPFIGKMFPQYIKYLTNDASSYSTSPKLAIFLMLALWLIMFIIAKKANIKNQFNKVSNMTENSRVITKTFYSQVEKINSIHEVAVWMGIIMLFLALQGTILNRFKYIFSVSMLVYYPNALLKIKNGNDRVILITGSCIVFFLYIVIIYVFRPEWQSTYPYSFFWKN